MSDKRSRPVLAVATIVLALGLTGLAHAQQTATEVFRSHQAELRRHGVHVREGWAFSSLEYSAAQVGKVSRLVLTASARVRAQLRFAELILASDTVPASLSPTLRQAVSRLALLASGKPFDLTGVEEVESRDVDGGYRLILALPLKTSPRKMDFGVVVSWLDSQVSLDPPAQDPLLLLELSPQPASDEAKVRQAIARLHDTTVERLFPAPTSRWSTAPDWVRRSPRPASTTTSLDDIPVSRLLELLIERPDDLQVRRRLQRGLRDSGFSRSADLFEAETGVEWRDGPPPRSELAEVPPLAAFCGVDAAWPVELILNTNGRLPWATPTRTSLRDEVRARFNAGDVKGAGRGCIESLERGSNPEALSYLSAICFQAKLHHLGAELGRLAWEADPTLPYAGVNRLRHLKALDDKETVKAEYGRIAASPALNEWGRSQLESIRAWMADDTR